MRLPLSWLRTYLDLPESAEEIAELLAGLGFPVEAIERRPTISGVLVGRIERLEPHPNADRLQICTIDVGAPTHLTIATGATNVAVGQVVPVATIGAELPEVRIARRTMRGVESEGMLCSATELGLPGEWFEDGILQLEADAPLGADIVAHYGLADPILDVEITANRPDALGIIGLARELAARLERPLRLPISSTPTASAGRLRVDLASPDVDRFSLQRLDGLRHGPSPTAIRIRLALAGQRPIDCIVDVTNLVMLEFGQPMHAYDADRIFDEHLVVRDAGDDATIRTLDGAERRLEPTTLVIADERTPVAVAGIIGGATSAVGERTTSILLEAAHFRAARIRRGMATLGLRTEAATRFARNPAPGLVDLAAARALALFQQQGAIATSALLVKTTTQATPVIELPLVAVQRLLGIAVSQERIVDALTRLGCDVRARDNERLLVATPPWRGDVTESADLVEEVARIVGYDQIPTSEGPIMPNGIMSSDFVREQRVADALAAAGFGEVVTLALESESVAQRWSAADCALPGTPIAIANPLTEEHRFLRFSLLPGLLELLERRMPTLREHPLHAFALGNIFWTGTERRVALWLSAESRLAGVDRTGWQEPELLAFLGRSEQLLSRLVGLVPNRRRSETAGLHRGKCAAFTWSDAEQPAAFAGAVDARLLAAYQIHETDVYVGLLDLTALPPWHSPTYRPPSRHPVLRRDLALVLDEGIAAGDLLATVRGADPRVREARLFDEYRGTPLAAGEKSLALHLSLGSDTTTLTDADADAAVAQILQVAQSRLGATLRR